MEASKPVHVQLQLEIQMQSLKEALNIDCPSQYKIIKLTLHF